MKIAILSPIGRSGKPEHGGIETVVKNLANAFVQRDHGVDLLVYPERNQEPSVGPVNAKVNIVRLHAQHKHTLVRALVRYSHRDRPDVLLAASHRANMVAYRASEHLAEPMQIFVSEHNTVSEGIKDDSRAKQWLRLRQVRLAYQRAHGVVAVSRGVAEDLELNVGVDPARITVIYNPIVTDDIAALSRESVDHPWFRAGEPPVVLGVGRLAPQKDFPTLLRAFARLRRARPARLVILGEGKERARLQALARTLNIESDVDLFGFASNPFAYMRQAAVLALSSTFEGFGNVIAEALAVGTPVVSTDCPHGPREILDDGLYGPLAPVGDADALAEGIQSMLSAPPPTARLIDRAQSFSTAAIADRYLSLFSAPSPDVATA